MKSLSLTIAVALLAATGQARASGGAVARSETGEADLARTVVLIDLTAPQPVVTVRPEVRASGEFAVILPAPDGVAASVQSVDRAELVAIEERTAPRWVTYSSGCGSEALGGSTPEDASKSLAVEPSPPAFDGASGAMVDATLSGVLTGLRSDGFSGLAPELDSAEEGRWLVIRAVSGTPADSGSAKEGPAAPVLRYASDGGQARVDLGLLARARSGRSDVIAIVLAEEPMAAQGLPTAEMKPPTSAPDVGLDIGKDYSAWVDRRVDFIGVGGPAALLEFSGSVKVGDEVRWASRWRISVPSGVAPEGVVTFIADPKRGRHRVRAIVSASLALPALLLLLLFAVAKRGGRRRLGLWLLLPLIGMLTGGCPSVGLLRGATVLERGTSEWTYALAPARDVRHDLNQQSPSSPQNRTPRTVQPEVAWRYGWRHETDVTVRMFVGGAKGEVRTLLLRQSDVGVNVSAGFGVSGFVHPNYGDVCSDGGEGQGEDGCFTSLFGGGTVDLPVLVSREVGDSEFYFGLRGGGLLMRGETTYSDPNGEYADIDVTKSVVTGLVGVIFGVSVGSAGYRFTPELQILSSRAAGGNVIWFPVVGVGFSPRTPTARASAAR